MNIRIRSTSYLVALCTVIILAGCTGSRRYSDLPTEVADYTKDAYEIGVGDVIEVLVWRNPELSTKVPVRPDGKISAPLVGDIFAAGKTAPGLAKEIETILEDFVRAPKATVIVTETNSTEFINRVRVTGAVKSPTSMPFRKGMTVLDLLLLSGGTTEFANPNRAKLYRLTKDGVEIHNVYVGDILERGDVRSNYFLSPSDIITVPERLL